MYPAINSFRIKKEYFAEVFGSQQMQKVKK